MFNDTILHNNHNFKDLKEFRNMCLEENKELFDFIVKIYNLCTEEIFKIYDILVQYTDDEYGEESKRIGLIKRAYVGDAGLDLPTILNKEERQNGFKRIWPYERVRLHTGIMVAFPNGYFGRIIHRSSTEYRYRLRVVEGTIDQYRNELLVCVHNDNPYPIDIQHGQRLAQLIVLKTASFGCREVNKLPSSERQANGFGSSGI